ncbi:MAG: transposase [Desulfobulbaceae bacterium]
MTGYNPRVHNRQSIRLDGYDYSQAGAYFVTLCTVGRRCYFAQFSELRQIVADQWHRIPERFSTVLLDEYQIMPNHLHGILVIRRGAPGAQPGMAACNTPLLGQIIGAFKSLCVTDWLRVIKAEQMTLGARFWQANYYEHVIRGDKEMDCIREYICNNPRQWDLDRENPAVARRSMPKPPEKWMV